MSTLPNFADLPQWQQHIARVIKQLIPFAEVRARFNSKAIRALRSDIPYAIHTTDIAGTHVILNRDYKPIGLSTTAWVDYDQYPSAHISDAELKRVIPYFTYHQKSHHIEGRFFQDDCYPWASKKHATALMNLLVKLLASLHRVTENEFTRYCAAQYGTEIQQ
jgi:hypothetical protein